MVSASKLLPLALVLLAACGEDPATDARERDPLDLLVRRPDVVFEQPGLLEPKPGVDWGALGGRGWGRLEQDSKWVLDDGSYYIEANQPKVSLTLPAPAPEDREIVLTIWAARRAEGSDRTVLVRVNGTPLKAFPLEDEPTELRIAAPAALWAVGENLLELEVTPVAEWSGEGPRWDALAVASVAYGAPRRVEYEPGERASLPPTTGLRYLVETTGPAHLEFDVASDAGGTLVVELGTMDARTGELEDDRREQEFAVHGEREGAVPLVVGDGVEVVGLTWRSKSDAPLRLLRAEVVENDPAPRPPIILISVDTLSARHMSVYGYERATTPRLEEFAKDAIVFRRCVANAPWTLPSYLSALTGLYPVSHLVKAESGGVSLDNFDFWQLAKSRWTLAEMLRARGYQTAASVDTYWLDPRFHVDQGFDLYDLGPAAFPFHLPQYGIRHIFEQFLPYLDTMRDPAEPFFAFMHTLDVHGPYWPEEPFLGAFDDELPSERTMTPAGSAYQSYRAMPDWMATTLCPDPLRPKAMEWDVPQELPLEDVIARYDETILKTDFYLGELFTQLRERGLYDDCVIVITGDHGESFAHDAYSHGVLWEDVITVPLLVKLPGNAHGGTVVEPSVQLVDLYPTLFELAGGGAPRDYLHGRSLLGLIDGSDRETRPTYSEGGLIDQRTIEADGWKLIELRPGRTAGVASLVTHPMVAKEWLEAHLPEVARTGILKEEQRIALTESAEFRPIFRALQEQYAGPYYELYDLRSDPRETTNLVDREPARFARMKELMEARQAIGARAQADAKSVAPPLEMSDEQREALNALGYTGEEEKAMDTGDDDGR